MKVPAEVLQGGLLQPGAVWDGAPQVIGGRDDLEFRVAAVVVEVAACVGDGGDLVLVAVDESLEDPSLHHQVLERLPAVHGHAAVDELLGDEQVAGVDAVHVGEELDVGGMLLVDREQLRHRRHRQRRRLEHVLLVGRTGVSVLRHAALVARVDLRVREKEVDGAVRELVGPRQSLMMVLALAAEPVDPAAVLAALVTEPTQAVNACPGVGWQTRRTVELGPTVGGGAPRIRRQTERIWLVTQRLTVRHLSR
jgi:hypothetical protein